MVLPSPWLICEEVIYAGGGGTISVAGVKQVVPVVLGKINNLGIPKGSVGIPEEAYPAEYLGFRDAFHTSIHNLASLARQWAGIN